MKVCPTCMSKLFDDMDTCFGCMYRFGSEPEREREAEGLMWPPTPQDVNEVAVFEEALPWEAPAGGSFDAAPPPGQKGQRVMSAGGLVLRVDVGEGCPGAPLLTITIEPA